jgi:hypothetical protein
MAQQNKLSKIIDSYPEHKILKANGFDDAVIGIESSSGRLVYSVPAVIDILMEKHSMEYEDAIEFFSYNIEGSFVGDKTPIWVNDRF